MPYIYLASPYSHPDSSVRQQRFDLVLDFAAWVAKNSSRHIFSPILHWHPVALHHNLPKDAEYWKTYNYTMQHAAGETWVLVMPGWKESLGVTHEIELAKELNQQVVYLDPVEILEG